MALRLKNISSVEKLFGVTNGYGAFANNEVIKNNPQLISILASKKTRVAFKKRNYSTANILDLKSKTLKQSKSLSATLNKQQKASNIKNKEDLKKLVQVTDTSKTEHLEQKPDLENAYQAYKWCSFEKGRYYNVYLQPTLLGNYSITKSWGGLKNHLGNCKTVFFENLKDAYVEIRKIAKQRKYKGYVTAKERQW